MADDSVKKETEFEKFRGFYAEYITSKRAAGAGDASSRMDARNYALRFYADHSQDTELAQTLTNDNLARIQQGDQFYIDSLLDAAVKYNTERFRSHFKADNLEAIVKDASKEKLSKNFLRDRPLEVKGDDWHNERAAAHDLYFMYERAAHGDEKAGEVVSGLARGEFIKQGVDKLEKRLKDDKNLSESTRKVVLNAIQLNAYRRDIRVPENILGKYASDVKKRLSDELEKMFKNDEEKAKYAVRNIADGAKTLMQQSEEGFDKAAHMVASIDS